MEKVISIEDITEITKEALTYKDKSGELCKVSFEECKQNWIDYVNANEFVDWNGNRVHLLPGQSIYVGTYNSGKSPYILLYSNEKVKIELVCQDYHKLNKLQKELPKALYEAGVSTFNMT